MVRLGRRLSSPTLTLALLYFLDNTSASRSFGDALKGIHLPCQREVTIFHRNCSWDEAPCAMHHFWSGGTFPGYPQTRVRYYVDGEHDSPSVSIPIGLGHGLGPSTWDDNGPWSAGHLFGRSGVGLHAGGSSAGSGLFNTFNVPFNASINITISLGCAAGGAEYFWVIVRGRTKASIQLPGGFTLPPQARLATFESAVSQLPPYGFVPFFNASSIGAAAGSAPEAPSLRGGTVLSTTLAVQSPSKNFAFLEGCVRATEQQPSPPATSNHSRDVDDDGGAWKLSSGTEDYFLGTFYFDRGQYMNPLAGVTSLCPQPQDGRVQPAQYGCVPEPDGTVTFSAYRVHAGADALMFEGDGLSVTWRNGEPGHGGRAATVNASTFAMVYVW
jgi:hypothetical protein